jgi:hypothetical protein
MKKSNKVQGKEVSGASPSDTRIMPEPRTMSRGIGSSFAMAVSRLMDMASSMSGSKSGFLGVEKKAIDSDENMHSSLLPKDFDPSKKLGE